MHRRRLDETRELNISVSSKGWKKWVDVGKAGMLGVRDEDGGVCGYVCVYVCVYACVYACR